MGDVSLNIRMHEDATAKLSRISSAARNAASTMQQAGKVMDSAFKTNAPGQFASNVGKAMDSAASEAGALGEAIEEAFSGFDAGLDTEWFDDAADGAERASEAVGQLADRTNDIGNGNSLSELSDDARMAGESMDQASGKAFNLSDALKKLAAAAGVAKLAGELKDFTVGSVEIGRDFTSMMSEVAAISGASGSDLAQLEETARGYGATTVFSASEAAEALKYMSLAGWDAQQSTSALGGVLDLAAASGMGLGAASDMVTDYLTAFGMAADQSSSFADMLAYAQSNSNTTVAQLGEAYRNSAANLHAAGQDVETATSLLEAMANQGYKGSEAGTALAATMRDITQQMEDGAIKIGKTSIAVQDADGDFRDLTDILKDVEDATLGMGDAEKAAALGSTFTADSIKAVNMILAEGVGNVAGYEEALRHADGTAERMSGTMTDNLAGDLAGMNSAFEELQLQVFEGLENPLREGVQYITSEIIPELTEWVPDAFEAVAEGAAKIGNAIKPVVGTLLKNPKAVGNALAGIGTGLAVFKTASIARNLVDTSDGMASLTGTLGKLGATLTGGHPLIAGAAALAGAVIAIKGAVEEYNEIQMEDNLSDHFGDFHLDDMQVDELASQVMPVDVIAQLDLAEVEFDKAEELVTQGEAALEENNYLIWKVASVGLELTEGERGELIANGQEFVDSVKEAFQSNEYGAEETVKALLGDQSSAVIETMQGWFNEDNAELESLGSAITSILENSFGSGIEEVDMEGLQSRIGTLLQDAFNAGETGDTEALSNTIADILQDSLGDSADLVDRGELTEGINNLLQEAVSGEGIGTEELSSRITELFQDSIDTGVSDIDTAAALSILQTKMMQMVNGAKQAELQGKLDWLSITTEGAALDPESWAAVVGQIEEYQDAIMAADEGAYQSLLATVEQAVFNDPSRQGEADAIIEAVKLAYGDLQEGSLVRGWEWMSGSMNEAYEEELSALQAAMEQSSFKDKITGDDPQKGLTFAWSDLEYAIDDQFKDLDSGTRAALADRYETMLPTVEQMDEIISRATENGEAVPEALMTAYREAMAMGAASGSEEALWQYMANEVAQDFPGMDEFVSQLEANGMNFSDFPEEVQKCFEKAFVDTSDTDYSSLMEDLASAFSSDEVDWSAVQELLNEHGYEIDLSKVPMTVTGEPDFGEIAKTLENLEATGESRTVGEELQLEYKITGGDSLWSIVQDSFGLTDGEEIQAAIDQIAEANGISQETYEIIAGDMLWIPGELIPQTDEITEKAGKAANEVSEEAQEAADNAGEDVTMHGTVNGEYTAGEAAGAENAAENLGNQARDKAENAPPADPVEKEIPASIVIELQSLDDEALSAGIDGAFKEQDPISVTIPADVTVQAGAVHPEEAVQNAAKLTGDAVETRFAEIIPTSGIVDVQLSETDNVPEIYNMVGDAVSGAFAVGYAASASVRVLLTADYSLANPTKTIEFSGGASGTAMVNAALHAEGGYFDEPHLGWVAEAGVGEYIIPMDGSERSIGMWQDAGRMLGAVQDDGDSISPALAARSLDSAPAGSESSTGSEKTINLNINGSGAIKASGTSKEEVLQIIMDNIKDVIMGLLQDDIQTEGEAAYEW